MLGRFYETWEAFFADVELMCANAMLYNEDASEVYRDAEQIKVGFLSVALPSLADIHVGYSRFLAPRDTATVSPCTSDYARSPYKVPDQTLYYHSDTYRYSSSIRRCSSHINITSYHCNTSSNRYGTPSSTFPLHIIPPATPKRRRQ
jgi:hypothetical protein